MNSCLFFPSFSLRVCRTSSSVMLVKAMKSACVSYHSQREEGTAYVQVNSCVTPSSQEKTRRIRQGFGKYLEGSPKMSCSQFLSLLLSGTHDPRGLVLLGAKVIHSLRNARNTRDWAVAITSASAMRGCRTV